MIREPFCIPQCIHRCLPVDFENFDVDQAGCLLCGKIHVCDKGHCVLSEEDGHVVCEITGYCVRKKIFSDNEFVDTVACISQDYQAQLQNVDSNQLEFWIEDVLVGHKHVLVDERRRNKTRKQAILMRILKHFKTTKANLNLIDVFTCFINATKNIREPLLLPESTLRVIVKQCSDIVITFCGRFFLLSKSVPSVNKLHGFIIGILYLMRNGLRMHDCIELLPPYPILHNILPVETQIKRIFRMSTKIMTETENTIKRNLKQVSREQLRNVGFV